MKRTRPRRWMRILLLVGAAVCVLRFLFHGQSEADRLKAELEARGERLTLEALAFGMTTSEDPAWSVLGEAAQRFKDMSGAEVDSTRGVEPEWVRSEPPQVAWEQPFLYSCRYALLEWDRAAAIVDRVQPELASLHEVMRSPAAQAGWEGQLAVDAPIPNYIRLREAAQGLHEFLQAHLHRGAIDPAFTNLVTLVRLCRYHRETGFLVVHMMRVALTGLTVDALWQALQAPGLSEAQLEALQLELTEVDLLEPFARTLEVERAARLQSMARYRDGGVAHLQNAARQLGFPATQTGLWKKRLHHAHWSLFRYRDAELRVIQEMQQQINRTRLLAEGHPLDALPAEPAPRARPALDARFDDWAESKGTLPVLYVYYGDVDFSPAISSVARSETARRLALVALALERFRLATGGLPETLEQLVPEYLETVPKDLLEGHPVHYERQTGDRFSLYAQDAAGQLQSSRGAPLAWPAAEPPLPFVDSPQAEDEAQHDDVLPLVQFDDAPLMDVIKALARQAGINLTFDPWLLKAALRRRLPVSLATCGSGRRQSWS